MVQRATPCLAIALTLCAACSNKQASEPPGPVPARATTSPPPPTTSPPVQIEMRNVRLHVVDGAAGSGGIVLDVKLLRGEMVSTHPDRPPVFDDPRSYVLDVSDGEVAMDMASLTNLMNRQIFNYDDAPLSDIEVEADGNELKQKGKLHKGVTLPFSMKATVAATPDGRMRLHTESVSTLKIPAKKLMDVFGLSLDDLVSIKQRRGIEIDGDDVVITPGRVLPPPEIRGRLTRVAVANGVLRQTFGSGKAQRLAPPDIRISNYIYFGDSSIRFGKLTMSQADLMLVDADPKDTFDFSPARYNAQLVAGYSKNTPTGGLRTFMPDLDDLRPQTDLRPTTDLRPRTDQRSASRK